jgi:hypothetical protein
VEGGDEKKGKHNGNILIADFFDVEKPALCPDVSFTEVLDAVDNGGSDGERDTVVI